ncbi:uncharacterized protein LOC132924956 [Rhopalosiphum padi]|uniref:uncharacterized protein LOC132924956 n=1 Tax=Rhopalosiphum padi TaxID=40932 RepID=UPI00298E764A|nr:uncharacterized protein LOC132924956 [Rhopalosiphum padi]
MAPKKSAYFTFLKRYRDYEIRKGRQPSSYEQLSVSLSPVWNNMTEGQKDRYKVLANRCISNTNHNIEQPLNHISNEEEIRLAVYDMEKLVAEMFKNIPNDQELLNKKFILLHINCHSFDEEQYYFPAEISAIEFNLKNGLSRTYQQIIGFSENKLKGCPPGHPYSMRRYAKQYHQIDCLDKHPDDYENIFFEFLTFLKDGIINKTDVKEGKLDLPYLFTVESNVDENNIKKTINSLERLYSSAFPEVDAEVCKSTFKIGNAEQLLLEIKKKMNLPSDDDYHLVRVLEYEYYVQAFCCKYHESIRTTNFKCSKARIIQWMTNICNHINTFIDLNLVPGRHMAARLNDHSILIIENAHLPLTAADLNLNKNASYYDILSNSRISPQS